MSARKALLQSIAAVGISAFALTAAAQARPDYGPAIDLAGAKKIAAGALAECRNNKWNVAVAIVDTHGSLVHFERMDNTQTASPDIAIMKARNGAMYRRPTRAWADTIAKTGPAVMTLPGVVASPGGLPIMADGKVIGGVGVSGVTGDQDEQCAKAGLAGM
ncbi:MAG: GlcG/HbpS family heme-binding protein [Burkholderiales bacterium]